MTLDTGVLYVVSTPIGNIKDITYRAIEVLKTADIIYSENTAQTQKILNKYDISTPQSVYTDQRHTSVYNEIVNLLASGKNIALVSDNGTPLISDPGYKLINQLRKDNYKIESVPGPSAVTAALSISGLPTDKFVFLGFLPKKASQRKELLSNYSKLDATLTLYESPYRLKRLLTEIFEILGNREVVIIKDLTKKFEKVTDGYIKDLISNDFKTKGEYTILIKKE